MESSVPNLDASAYIRDDISHYAPFIVPSLASGCVNRLPSCYLKGKRTFFPSLPLVEEVESIQGCLEEARLMDLLSSP